MECVSWGIVFICLYVHTYRKIHIGNMQEMFLTTFSYIYDLIICHILYVIYIYAMLFENLNFFAIVEPLQKEKYEFT